MRSRQIRRMILFLASCFCVIRMFPRANRERDHKKWFQNPLSDSISVLNWNVQSSKYSRYSCGWSFQSAFLSRWVLAGDLKSDWRFWNHFLWFLFRFVRVTCLWHKNNWPETISFFYFVCFSLFFSIPLYRSNDYSWETSYLRPSFSLVHIHSILQKKPEISYYFPESLPSYWPGFIIFLTRISWDWFPFCHFSVSICLLPYLWSGILPKVRK